MTRSIATVDVDPTDLAIDLAKILPRIDEPVDGVLAYDTTTRHLRICSQLTVQDTEQVVATYDGVHGWLDDDNPTPEDWLALAETILANDLPEVADRMRQRPDQPPGEPPVTTPDDTATIAIPTDLAVRLTAAAAAHDTDVADLLDTMLDELELAGRPFTVTAASLADRVRYIISRHATLDGAVQALRTVQADDADGVQRGLPSAAPRIEHGSRPVAIEVPMTVDTLLSGAFDYADDDEDLQEYYH